MHCSRYSAVCLLCLMTISVLVPRVTRADSQPAQTAPSTEQKAKPVSPPDEAHRAAADAILQQLWHGPFSVIDTVVKQCDQSDAATRNAVIWLALQYMKDVNRDPADRWPCCYVVAGCKYVQGKMIGGGKYEPAVPDLIDLMQHDEAGVVRGVAAEALGMLYLSTHNIAAADALVQAASGLDRDVRPIARKYVNQMKANPVPDKGPAKPVPDKSPASAVPNPPDQAHRASADALLRQMLSAQPGAPMFVAIDSVVKAYNGGDAATKNAITWLALTYMKDTTRVLPDRWPCCYVISGCRYEQGVPDLIDLMQHDGIETMRSVAAEALGMLYLSTHNAAAADALVQAAREGSSEVRRTAAKYVNKMTATPVPNPPDKEHRAAADALLQQIWSAEPGAPKFVAIDSVVKAYNGSDVATKNAVTWLCLTYMKDETRGVLDRWPCCYVISGCKYEQGVTDLIDLLQHDPVEAMRAVAAEALGEMYVDTHSTVIRDALLHAARTDKSKRVRDAIAKYLGKDMPAYDPGS